MCQIDGCKKQAFAICFDTGVLICTKHTSIRPRFRVMKGKKYRDIYNKWRKDKIKSKPESYENEDGEILYV